MNHQQLQDLLGVFALHALDADEADLVRAHLGGCRHCRDEVAVYQQTAATLASTGGEAPRQIWDAIAARIDRAATPESAIPMPRLGRPGRSIGPSRKRSRLAAWAVAVAAVAVTAVAVMGLEVGHLNQRLNHIAQANAATAVSAAARTALLDPGAQRAMLTATGGRPKTAAAEIVTEPTGAAFLFNRQLTPLSPSQTYQLWTLNTGRAISVGLLGPDPAVVAFTLDPSPTAGVFALTIEPAGGSVAPTRPPIASTT